MNWLFPTVVANDKKNTRGNVEIGDVFQACGRGSDFVDVLEHGNNVHHQTEIRLRDVQFTVSGGQQAVSFPLYTFPRCSEVIVNRILFRATLNYPGEDLRCEKVLPSPAMCLGTIAGAEGNIGSLENEFDDVLMFETGGVQEQTHNLESGSGFSGLTLRWNAASPAWPAKGNAALDGVIFIEWSSFGEVTSVHEDEEEEEEEEEEETHED
jgi:hypothetical protein